MAQEAIDQGILETNECSVTSRRQWIDPAILLFIVYGNKEETKGSTLIEHPQPAPDNKLEAQAE